MNIASTRACVLLFGFLVVTLPAAAQDKPRPAGQKHALLIGVRQYDPKELRSLPFAEADVTDLAAVLKDAGYQRVVRMTQKEGAENAQVLPTGANIRKALNRLVADCQKGDTVVVALAGHGVEFRNEDIYFCPMDAQLADRKTLLAMKEITEKIEGSPATVKLLFVDVSRGSQGAGRARIAVDLDSVPRKSEALPPPGGMMTLFSCSAGEKAFESAKLKHGVFFHFLIEGLKGSADMDKDRRITISELSLFQRRRVSDWVREEFGVRQTPEVVGNIRGIPVVVELKDKAAGK